MELMKIGTYEPPNITAYNVDFDDAIGTDEETEAGTTLREVIRQEKPKITFSCTAITEEQVMVLLSVIKPASFTITYWSDAERTCTMKCTGRSLTLFSATEEEGAIVKRFNISVKLESC